LAAHAWEGKSQYIKGSQRSVFEVNMYLGSWNSSCW